MKLNQNQISEITEVRELCNKIGYGNVMRIASILWKYKLSEFLQTPNVDVIGNFIPVTRDMIKKSRIPDVEVQEQNYNVMIKEYLSNL